MKSKPYFLFSILFVPAMLSATALGDLAKSMPSGTWAKLVVPNQDEMLRDVGASASKLGYTNAMPWNPVLKTIEILGQDHNYALPGMPHTRYEEAANQFVVVTLTTGIVLGHGFDHTEVNPFTGDIYHHEAQGDKNWMRALNSTSPFTSVSNASPRYTTVAEGTCWWTGTFAGAGSQGCWMIFNSGDSYNSATDGRIMAYDPTTQLWFYNRTGRAPFYGTGYVYNSVMEYSRKKNVAVYGGGNVAPDKLWRLNADGSFITLPDVPSGTDVGIQRGLLVDDPVTGNFLLLSSGELWELNPSGTGVWTQQTGQRTPPVGVGVPNPYPGTGMFATSIPDYGVVAYVTQKGWAGGTFYLYKHVDSTSTAAEARVRGHRAEDLSVSPNPVRGRAVLRAKGRSSLKGATVIDGRGRRVACVSADGVWNATGIPAGLYIVRAEVGGRILSRRVVVE